MATTWTNGRITLTKDWVFGVSVLCSNGSWLPLDQLEEQDLLFIISLVNHDLSCPFKEDFRRLRQREYY